MFPFITSVDTTEKSEGGEAGVQEASTTADSPASSSTETGKKKKKKPRLVVFASWQDDFWLQQITDRRFKNNNDINIKISIQYYERYALQFSNVMFCKYMIT